MKRTFDHIRDGMMLRLEIDTPRRVPALSKLLDSEWCMEFEGLMRRRLIFGAFRYGTFAEHEAKGSNEYNNVQSAIDRLKLYQLTGNMEHLVDAANLCLKEFKVGSHPLQHFEAGDDLLHTPKLRKG